MNDKLSAMIARAEKIVGKAMPAPWLIGFPPPDTIYSPTFTTKDGGILGSVTNYGINLDDAQAIVAMRSLIEPLLEVAKAGANIRGNGSYNLNDALAKLAEVEL